MAWIIKDGIPQNTEAPDVEPIDTEPLPKSRWRVENGIPTTDNIIKETASIDTKPLPLARWRIDPNRNDGIPFHELLPDIPKPVNIWSLERKRAIHVYDLNTAQNGFEGNGLAILNPTECTSLHNDGRWEITLRHPLDEWGKWRNLLVNNVLKVDGQLFRIDITQPELSESGKEIYAHAMHISRDLADRLITFAKFAGGNANRFIDFIFSAEAKQGTRFKPYSFEGYSDIETVCGEQEYINTTLLGALIGTDNSLINRYGGELFCDNFYFSINKRMENARDNAFYLRYSLDMVKISQKLDYSDYCTDLFCYDNFGAAWAVSYSGGLNDRVHHAITRMVQFNYSEHNMEQFIADGEAYWSRVNTPKVTYEVEFASLRGDERYADFVNLQNYNYGDSGTIYCPELGINDMQKITEIEKDELTGDIIRMVLGNLASSFVRPSYMGSTISSGDSITDRQNRTMQNAVISQSIAGAEKYPINRLETMTINELEGR